MKIDNRSEECVTDQCSNAEEFGFLLFVDRLKETNVSCFYMTWVGDRF